MKALCLKMLEEARTLRNRALNLITPPAVVLLYHRVADLGLDTQMLSVTPDNFREQMRYLKEHFSLLSLDEDWARVSGPAVAVSFDDGYADNLEQALPIIEEVGVPVTFFVTTGQVDSTSEFWWDELERILLVGQGGEELLTLDDGGQTFSWTIRSSSDRKALYNELLEKMRRVDSVRRDNWFRQLQRWAGLDAPGRKTHRAMTLSQLRELASSPWVTIGAHTVTHSPLSSLSRKKQVEEINAAKIQLQTWLERPISLFSYPFGGPMDFSDDTVRIVRESGFERAYVNYPGQIRYWTNEFRLPRHLVRNWSADEFKHRLKHFWTHSA